MKELITIQSKLKAPKSQRNNFGKYNYRSCEDILEAVKPLLAETKTTLTITDDITMIGERYYIKATTKLLNEKGECIASTTAFARESEKKAGMDESQITGSASSYARKYALNGLFAIDDTKDADATNTHDMATTTPAPKKFEDTKLVARINSCKTVDELKKLFAEYNSKGLITDELTKVFTAKKNLIANAVKK